MEAIVHHHPVDLAGRVKRWRADPEALPALIRDHHAAECPPDDHNDSAPAAYIAVAAAFAIYVTAGILYHLMMGGAA